MTLFDEPTEPEVIPQAPGVNALAQILNDLKRASLQDGSAQTHRLEHGLVIAVSHDERGLCVALSRDRSTPSGDEVDTVARDLGWSDFEREEVRAGRGARWVVLRRTKAPEAPKVPPLSNEERAAAIARLEGAMHPEFTPHMRDLRRTALKGMKDDELREEIAWLERHPMRFKVSGDRTL